MGRRDKRLAYQGKIEADLKEWGSQIDRWQEQKWDAMQQVISDLNSKRQVVRHKLADMKQATDDQWQNFRSDMDRAVEDMRRAMNEARQKIH